MGGVQWVMHFIWMIVDWEWRVEKRYVVGIQSGEKSQRMEKEYIKNIKHIENLEQSVIIVNEVRRYKI